MIFGRRNCNYNKDWLVRVNLVDNSTLKVSEQMTREHAKEVYMKAKAEFMDDKTKFLEVEFENRRGNKLLETFLKKNIISIELGQDI